MLGVKDVDRKILLELDDISLLNACQTDTGYAKLCRDDQFWRIRYTQQFGEHAAQYKKQDVTWRNHYLKTLIDLENFPGLIELSKMIAWDTQGDWKSSYWVDRNSFDFPKSVKFFSEAPEEIMNWFWLKKIDKVTISIDFWDEQKTVSFTLIDVTPHKIYEETSRLSKGQPRFILQFLYYPEQDEYSPSYVSKVKLK